MGRLTGYDTNKELIVCEEERILCSNGIITKDEMYKIMRHLAEKIAEYEDLEEQGKLLKLLCAVGADVWYISERAEKQGRKKIEVPFVDHGVVDNITLGHMMIPQITVCNNENIWTTFSCREDFGEIVFLTEEEAEAALKELSFKESERIGSSV